MAKKEDQDKEAARLELHIRRAYEVVSDIGIQEESLKLEAFKYALRPDSLSRPSHSNDTLVVAGVNTGQMRTDRGPGNGYQKIAAALGVATDVVELLYDIGNRTLTLNLPPTALPKSSLAAMKEIAIVLTVGRKYAGLSVDGAGTPFDLIRLACDEQAKLDKKNFAMAMGSMRPMLTSVGKGMARELVAKKPADNLARDILLRYSQHSR